jgi:hypothetical protein
MRRAVLSTAASSTHRFAGRRRAWAVAGALAVTAAAAGVSRWLPAHPNEAPPPSGVLVESATRQLQFATPSGTRVIWVFNPDFQP